MRARLQAGVNPGLVAMSKRDFQKATNAGRDSELHIFNRAWQAYAGDYLYGVTIPRTNGQDYLKFLPSEEGQQAA